MRPTTATRVGACLLALGLTALGCSSDDEPDGERSTTSSAQRPTTTAVTQPVVVGVGFAGVGRGDRSIDDAVAEGLDAAKTELGAESRERAVGADGDRAAVLAGLVGDGADPVVAVGPAYAEAVGTVAAKEPSVTFVAIDAAATGKNVRTYGFATEQGAYLVGAIAGLKTQADHVGFVGGTDDEATRRYQAGFAAGVKRTNADATIDVDFVGNTTDAARAKDLAAAQYAAGADVVFAVAGDADGGVLDAAIAAGEGRWVIGADTDRAAAVSVEQQRHVLTSMLKRYDVAMRRAVEDAAAGQRDGDSVELGAADDGVDFSTSGGNVDDVKEQVAGLAKRIADGSIRVPTEP